MEATASTVADVQGYFAHRGNLELDHRPIEYHGAGVAGPLRFDVLMKTKTPELHRYWTTRDRAAKRRLVRLVAEVLHAIEAGVFHPIGAQPHGSPRLADGRGSGAQDRGGASPASFPLPARSSAVLAPGTHLCMWVEADLASLRCEGPAASLGP